MTDHPITPPPELVQHWIGAYFGCQLNGEPSALERRIAREAASWGYQQCADEIAAETERAWLDGETD